jgi:hypothetical protein
VSESRTPETPAASPKRYTLEQLAAMSEVEQVAYLRGLPRTPTSRSSPWSRASTPGPPGQPRLAPQHTPHTLRRALTERLGRAFNKPKTSWGFRIVARDEDLPARLPHPEGDVRGVCDPGDQHPPEPRYERFPAPPGPTACPPWPRAGSGAPGIPRVGHEPDAPRSPPRPVGRVARGPQGSLRAEKRNPGAPCWRPSWRPRGSRRPTPGTGAAYGIPTGGAGGYPLLLSQLPDRPGPGTQFPSAYPRSLAMAEVLMSRAFPSL